MLPRKFAKKVGLRTAVCKAIETEPGWNAMKLGPELSELLTETSMLFKSLLPRSISYQSVALLGTVRLSVAIDCETAGHRLIKFSF